MYFSSVSSTSMPFSSNRFSSSLTRSAASWLERSVLDDCEAAASRSTSCSSNETIRASASAFSPSRLSRWRRTSWTWLSFSA